MQDTQWRGEREQSTGRPWYANRNHRRPDGTMDEPGFEPAIFEDGV